MPEHVVRTFRPRANRAAALAAALTAALGMGASAQSAAAAPSAPGYTHTTPAPWSSDAVVSPGTAVLSDAEAASRVRSSYWEPRPQNAKASHTEITYDQLEDFRRNGFNWDGGEYLRQQITGHFEGTTDEIIQWAAAKWGLPADVIRAAAVNETYWRHEFTGDNGRSHGLMQIKTDSHPYTYPASATSIAFNVDYYAATIRYYYDGHASRWMNDQPGNGDWYREGDLWGSVGAWYSGRWHDWGADHYISKVKGTMWNQTWLWQWF